VTEHFATDQSERVREQLLDRLSSTRLRNGVRSSSITAKWPGWWPWKWASGQHSSRA
jgi:hypothetical protein